MTPTPPAPTDPAGAITDPTLTADYVFAVPHDPADLPGLMFHLHAAVAECQSDAGVDAPVTFAPEPHEVEVSRPLYSFGRRPTADGRLVDLAVRQAHDAVWVQAGDLRRGTFPADGLPSLRPTEPVAFKKQSLSDYLGLFLRCTVEFTPGLSPGEVRAVAHATAAHYFPVAGWGEWHEIRTADGLLLVRFQDKAGQAVLAYPRGAGAAVTRDLHFTLPFLATCRFKTVRAWDNYRAYSADAARLNRDLRTVLDAAATGDRRPDTLQRRCDQMSDLAGPLAERLAQIEAGVRAACANREIARRLVAGATMFRESTGLDQIVAGDLADRLKDRSETEAGFRRGTLERARVQLQNLDATVEIQLAAQNRRMAWVIAALTGVQAFTAVPLLFSKAGGWGFDDWPTGLRISVAVAVVGLVLLGAKLWMRRPR